MKESYGRTEPQYMPATFQVNWTLSEGMAQTSDCWEEGRNVSFHAEEGVLDGYVHNTVK